MAPNRMARLEVFVGTWNTTGEVFSTEGAPATSLRATDTYCWLPGKHFIAHHVDARFGDVPSRSMEVIGYDSAKKKFFAHSYDDRGTIEFLDVELRGKRWGITGASVRFQGAFNSRWDNLTGLWELKSKRTGWTPWIDLALKRT